MTGSTAAVIYGPRTKLIHNPKAEACRGVQQYEHFAELASTTCFVLIYVLQFDTTDLRGASSSERSLCLAC